MSQERVELVQDHMSQVENMLESCEIDFIHFEKNSRIQTLELTNGIVFIFDSEGMLLDLTT